MDAGSHNQTETALRRGELLALRWRDVELLQGRLTAASREAAAGNPAIYVQMRAGHSQGSITERYVHAAQVLFPGAAERGEERLFGAAEVPTPVPNRGDGDRTERESA